jgi:ParB-like nuclease domain
MPASHPLANVFPLMDEAGLAELAADIRAESQREPIMVWDGQIIDGRNRYRACEIAGVEPVIKKIEFPGGEAEALAYALSRNLKRRHLTIAQRSVIAAKVATMRRGARAKPAPVPVSDLQPPAPVPEVSQVRAAEMTRCQRAQRAQRQGGAQERRRRDDRCRRERGDRSP